MYNVMDYAMDIFVCFVCLVLNDASTLVGICNGHHVPLVFLLLPGKSESRSLCKRRNLILEPTNVHIDIKVAMYTVLKNAQCTFKKEL